MIERVAFVLSLLVRLRVQKLSVKWYFYHSPPYLPSNQQFPRHCWLLEIFSPGEFAHFPYSFLPPLLHSAEIMQSDDFLKHLWPLDLELSGEPRSCDGAGSCFGMVQRQESQDLFPRAHKTWVTREVPSFPPKASLRSELSPATSLCCEGHRPPPGCVSVHSGEIKLNQKDFLKLAT